MLCLSQSKYVEKVIQRFRMDEYKVMSTSIRAHFKLSMVNDESECVDTEIILYS